MAAPTAHAPMILDGHAGANTWRPDGYRHRVFAAAASIAITGLLLVALRVHVQVPWPPGRDGTVLTVMLLQALPPEVSVEVPSTEPEAAVRNRHRRQPAANSAEGPLPLIVQPALHPIEPYSGLGSTEPVHVDPVAPLLLQGAEPAEISASAPLKLDAAVIKAAISQSKGLIQLNAEASGKPVPRGPGSRAEKFSSDLSSAGKNDCLASNEHGSLLSLPSIAYSALSGRCK